MSGGAPWMLLIRASCAAGLLVVFAVGRTRAVDGAERPATRERDVRVVSFNVRNSAADDGANAWRHRRARLAAEVRRTGADLLALQEVLAGQQDEIAADLGEYGFVSVGRDDGRRAGEACSVFFRAARFELRDSGTFWLSETPDVVGSKSWDAALPRICTWARLYDRASGRDALFANAHFDHVGRVARLNSAKLLLTRVTELAGGAPVIVAGDFNATEESDAYAAIVRPGGLVDAYRAVHPRRDPDEATFHAFKGGVAGSRIDWVLHSPVLTAVDAAIVRTPAVDGVYPSDHYAVTVTFR